MTQPDPFPSDNRLAGETSPYLLQHAGNPVAWRPWGPAAFEEARRRDVPIFLSIGYSTCYWCHVMERETFEDAGAAAVLNPRCVCVKVDREERPDVDDIYMTATQLTTGRGGWPMSVFLEPTHLRPIWCGTYLPPEPRHSMPSFTQVVQGLHQAWMTRREEILQQADRLAQAVRELLESRDQPVAVGATQIERAVGDVLRTVDMNHGGFGGAPKFPQPPTLNLLLDVRHVVDDAARGIIESALRLTLDKMACGGIHDHVGGGFHRYAVDAAWTVPHFEKMLYDNALLAIVYLRAAEHDSAYLTIARRTLDYVLREMTRPEGGFHSAQDAEVNGREGDNYVWTPDQLRDALGEDDGAFAAEVYGVSRGPNFKDPHHPESPPSNVLRLDDRPDRLAQTRGGEVFLARLSNVNDRLYHVRAHRRQPRLDDKILASWNGLMIVAMARAATTTGEARYLNAAVGACGFIRREMIVDGTLMRTWRAGQAKIPAFLEDYAAVIAAFVATANAMRLSRLESANEVLDEADRLARAAMDVFGDGSGTLYDARADQEDLFIRPRSMHDGAMPCGSSLMLHALLDLSEAGRDWLGPALDLIRSMSGHIAQSPLAVVDGTRGLLRMLRADPETHKALGQGLPQPKDEAAGADTFTPVEVFADVDRVRVTQDEPAGLNLVLRIAPGYHIIAADPGAPGLIPLRLRIAGGGGLAVYADYPAGNPHGPDGARVLHGDFEFPIVIEHTGPRTGRPILLLTFQACTDTECLQPMTLELDVAIDGV